jgi:RyR domain
MTPRSGGGLPPAAVRRLLGAVNALSIPSCLPLVVFALLVGTASVAVGWWTVLPATLAGDELFNTARVTGLTVRALIGWPQPPDAPPMPWLVTAGIGIDVAGLALLLIGALIRFARSFIEERLARHAGDVRLVVLGDEAALVVAAEPTTCTNVLLNEDAPGRSELRGLRVRLDPEFLAATLPRVVPHMRELLALGIDPTANLELVRRALTLRHEVVPERQLERLWIRIDPRELRTSIGREEFPEFAAAAQEARLISLPEARCRRLLHEQPPNKVRMAGEHDRAAIVIIGLGDTGLELLGRLCAQAQSPTYDPLVIVLIDTEAPAIRRELLELWPGLALVAEIIALALEPRLPQSAAALFHHVHAQDLVPSCLYIALEDVALCAAWEREIGLAVRVAGRESPLVLSVAGTEESDRSLFAEEEEVELLQRELHTDYLRRFSGAMTKPSAVDWCRLPFDYREDNRSLADHFWTKALDLDLRIVPASGSDTVSIDQPMIDTLAAAEHRRWVASRAIAGWRFGETQSEFERTHPSMVAWVDLTEAERDKDRAVIRELPTVLRAAGLALQPLHSLSLPRGGLNESEADALVADAEHRARDAGNKVPHLMVPVEDARGFRLAQRLVESSRIAVSLVMAQPLIGLAAVAGLPSQSAAQLARAARTIWIVPPGALGETLARWPALAVGAPR